MSPLACLHGTPARTGLAPYPNNTAKLDGMSVRSRRLKRKVAAGRTSS